MSEEVKKIEAKMDEADIDLAKTLMAGAEYRQAQFLMDIVSNDNGDDALALVPVYMDGSTGVGCVMSRERVEGVAQAMLEVLPRVTWSCGVATLRENERKLN
jgi:hypothetical protein